MFLQFCRPDSGSSPLKSSAGHKEARGEKQPQSPNRVLQNPVSAREEQLCKELERGREMNKWPCCGPITGGTRVINPSPGGSWGRGSQESK